MDWAQLGRTGRHRQAPDGRFLVWARYCLANFQLENMLKRGRSDLPEAGLRVGQAALRRAATASRPAALDLHQVVGEHSGADPQFEAIVALGETALHAATSEQHRDASLDAGAKALTCLEGRALFVRFALRRSLAAPLRNAHQRDAILRARCQVPLTEEAAIRSIQFRSPAKGLPCDLRGTCARGSRRTDCPSAPRTA